ncbi:homeobox protein otx5-B-like isoform X1 [Phascolarctos cinereus]|uniref:Homeobox protein otx5-B-like isoform X2 n=1 Tax=Phascolarctos cinereus TaxID=38626 RepID=A0A6P5LM50_PHACI|nr:homeobox protein otx5-B-like isoform X2 [Phascolarctos cinereus]XP_020859393.1 homeobox protein otx5-B-like isoform X2 [Phascolarctos cinereus]XP_020859394.1 homeobox protein otx5-B-like isoform X2 [Phascolarctos cinereus]
MDAKQKRLQRHLSGPRKTSHSRSRPATMKPSKLEPALTSDSSTSSKKGAKRERTMFNEVQLDVLLGEFHKNPYPNYSVRSELANRLDVPESRIQNWFQNRRAKQSRQLKEKEGLNLSGQSQGQGEQSSLVHGLKSPQTSAPSQVPQESLPETTLAWPNRSRFPSSKVTKATLGDGPGFPETVATASGLTKEASESPEAWLQPPGLTVESHPCLKSQSWGSSPQSTPSRLQTLKRGQQPERQLWLEYLRQLHKQSQQYPWMQEYLEYLQQHPVPVAPALAPSPPESPLAETVPTASASLATEAAGPETTPAK